MATSGKTIAHFISTDQSHVLYRDAAGKIWDSWYDGQHWNLQQINLSGMTPGPAAVGDPSSFIYSDQSHILYRDAAGKIWDSWYDGQHWNLQQINLSGMTPGPAAVGDPSSFIIYTDQSHVLYCDAAGKIWDSWYDGQHWNLQQINLSGMTPGPAAVGDPSSFIYSDQSHVLYRDAAGKIWDSWYDGQHWNLQQINLSGMTPGPAAVGDPSSFIIYTDQSHVLYRDAAGKIWDSWYDGQHWNLQQINLSGMTPGPAAVGDPSSFIYSDQSHILYRDAAGKIWDSWYDGQHWNLQQINLSGMTPGPAAVGDPSSFIIYTDQSHVLYRDAAGKIWDSWYDGQHWNLQQINLSGMTPGPAAVGDPSSFIYATQPQVPNGPSGLRVTGVADRQISVSWIDQSDNEDGFTVRFRGEREGSSHTGSKSVGRNQVSASLGGLRSNYEYTISVVAFNADGESQMSNEVGATTPARSISVSKEGTGSSTVFVVTGTGFTPSSLVVIRITSPQLQQVQFSETAGGDGNFESRHSVPCVSGIQLTFTAFEDADPLGTFANAVITTCP